MRVAVCEAGIDVVVTGPVVNLTLKSVLFSIV
jgi:hypothetical protein